jgi:hypothetical protein
MSSTFATLLDDAKAAFRRRDCAAARGVTQRLLVVAKTSAQRETVVRLQNAVRRCKVPALGRARRTRRRAGGRLGAVTVTGQQFDALLESFDEKPEQFRRTAERIQQTANAMAKAGEGTFGRSDKVFISEVARKLGSTTARLAPILVVARNKGWLRLARADLVGAVDPKLVKDSAVKFLNTEANFVVADGR